MVYEAVGGPTFESSLRSLRPGNLVYLDVMTFSSRSGGRLVLVGNVTTAEVTFKLGFAVLQELQIIGSDSCTADELTQVFGFLHKTGISPTVHTVLPLEDVMLPKLTNCLKVALYMAGLSYKG